VSQLEVTILKDATTRVQALLSGQVDVALSLNPDDMSPLQTDGFGIYVSKNGQVQVWALPNLLKARSPLNDVRVRQAMNYAVDKEQMAATLLNGIADPASQGGTPNAFGYNADLKPYPYDPERARALLKEAGYSEGFSMIADVVVGLGPADAQIHQKTASDLGKVGIQVELRTTPYSARPSKFYGGLWGEADAFSTTWNSGLYRDVIRSASDFACTKPNPFFCDQEITALVAESQTLMDPIQRERALKQIMRLNHEKASSLWLVEYNTIIGLAPHVSNFATRSTGMAIEDVILIDKNSD
jgi:peptide/nickel transport system substrate-binding protein